MRMLFVTICSSCVCALASAQSTDAGAQMEETFEMVRDFMATERDLTIEEELRFTNAEGDGFWPIYEDYRAEIEAILDRSAKLIADYAANYEDLTEPLALDLIDEYFAIETDRLEVRQRYVASFLQVLPAQKLARFYQIENKIDAVAQLPLVRAIPLIEASSTVRRGQR